MMLLTSTMYDEPIDRPVGPDVVEHSRPVVVVVVVVVVVAVAPCTDRFEVLQSRP